MRLMRYRVKNFRSVKDSGWIDLEQVTALIGVNESGKTNLLLPLWKLNPAREGEIKPTSDFPKADYAAIRANPNAFIFITAEFDISEISDELARMTDIKENFLDTVHISKNFANEYTINFPKYKPLREVCSAKLCEIIKKFQQEAEKTEPLVKEGSLKQDITRTLSAIIEQASKKEAFSGAELKSIVSDLDKQIPENSSTRSSLVPILSNAKGALLSLVEELALPSPSQLAEVRSFIIERLPRFVYYSNYGNLDSEIYLPHVVDNLERRNLGAREEAKARTLRVLFSFVRLSAKEILELGKDFRDSQGNQPTQDQIEKIATKKRERTILLNSAGTDLTKKFRDWWKQGDYTFEFQADGDHFRIWVSDKLRPEKVELEDRSSGLQWFLSFYLVFLVESSRDHSDAVLLLDEPGLSLHPLAQRDLSAFFERLSKTNQLIYTTHSPFLVDADMLDRARKVFIDSDGSTKSSSDMRRGSDDPRKSGATYAIYSALNMNVAESILYGCHPVIVEGPSDQHYLTTIKTLLISDNRINPKREIVFPPSHGARNAKVVASILSGRDEVLPFMIFDGDRTGLKMVNDMKNGLYQTAKEKVLCTNSYTIMENSEIEDLFPPDFFVDMIDRWARQADMRFEEFFKNGDPIVPQIEAWAVNQGIVLDEGWKVEVSRFIKKFALNKGVSIFPEDVLVRWTKLFNDLGQQE